MAMLVITRWYTLCNEVTPNKPSPSLRFIIDDVKWSALGWFIYSPFTKVQSVFFEFKQQNAEMISRKSQVSSVAWDDDSFKPLGASLRV